jgi:hypothetical protein
VTETDGTDTPSTLTLGELAGLLAVSGVGVLAAVSLALAQTSHHDGLLAVGITVVVLGVAAAVAIRWSKVPTIRVDRVELGLVACALVVAGAFFLPGATYAYVDKDPGVYAAHAFAIARDGSVDVPDPVLAAGLDPPGYSGGRFPGLWLDSADAITVTSQFYHLHSALLATGHDLAGKLGVFQATPLLAVLAVVLVLLATRRAAGTLPAVLAAGILTVCMLEVWQAKSPSSEVLAQLLFVGALLGVVLAIEARWWPPAAVSGALVSIGFLARPDGVLYLVAAAVVVGALIAAGRFDARVGAFAGTMFALAPYALWNAYIERKNYTASNGVPGARVVIVAGVLSVAAGTAVHLVRRARRSEAAPLVIDLRWQRALGVLGAVAATATLLFLWFREDLLGPDFAIRPNTGERFATHDEDALRWLSWFLTIPGLVAIAVGTAVLLLRRWKPSLLALVLPGAALLPLYLWDARIASRLMWWGRRFVPGVLPAVAILIGLGLSWAMLQKRWIVVRALGLVTASYVLVFGASQSVELRNHDEMGGSWTMGTDVAATGTADGSLYLFTRPTTPDVIQPSRNLPGALALIHDRVSSILSNPPGMEEIDRYREALPDREVFVVVPGVELPPELPADLFELRATIEQPITFWEESALARPKYPREVPYTLSVWALRVT